MKKNVMGSGGKFRYDRRLEVCRMEAKSQRKRASKRVRGWKKAGGGEMIVDLGTSTENDVRSQ